MPTRALQTQLGNFIEARREALGLTREALARAAGTDVATVAALESQASPHLPEHHLFARLARALEVSPERLLRAAGYLSDEQPADMLEQRERQAQRAAELATRRTECLLAVGRALAVSADEVDIAGILVGECRRPLGAAAAGVLLLDAQAERLDMASSVGFPAAVTYSYLHAQLDGQAPWMHALRSSRPLWFASGEEFEQRYPAEARTHLDHGIEAVAFVPLVSGERTLGVFVIAFGQSHTFDEDECTFIQALVLQCSQAIERTGVQAAERQARAEAEAERARLHDLLMQAPALIVVTRGPEHVIELANPRFKELVGNRDLVGHPAREVLPELAEQGYIDMDDQVYASGEPFVGIEMPTHYDRDGDGHLEEGYFNFVIQPTRGTDGVVDGLMIHAFEVTEQVLARRGAEKLAAERVAILGQITDGIVLADTDGLVTYINPAGQHLLGTSEIGVPLSRRADTYRVYTLEGSPYPAEELPLSRAALHGETVLDASVMIRSSHGDRILETNATPLLADDGTRLGAVATFRDVTSQRLLARQKDDFLAAAAHDLRTPLTTIKGIAQLVQLRAARPEGPDIPRIVQDLQRIDATTGRMHMLINKLLDLTRLQMNQPLDLRRSPTDLVALVRRMVEEQQHASPRHRIIVRSEESTLVGEWDGFRLERAISNLLSNATKYSPDGGEVLVSIRLTQQANRPWAVLAVGDRGLGIPEDAQPHIFDRFYRASNTNGIPGVGIGLAGTQQVVEQHGGRIEVDSRVDEGTTITVHLPLQGTPTQSPS